MLTITFLFIIKILASVCHAQLNCYSVNKHAPFIHYFAAQTPYFPPTIIERYHIKNCQPSKIWLAIRHGTCHPPVDIMDSFNLLQELRGKITKTNEMCQNDFYLIKNWKLNTSFIPHDLTSPQGWNDQRSLAKRWHHRYPTLFDDKYSLEAYKFGHTSTIRTRHSCQAFTQGLFGENENYNKIHRSTNDILLSPFMNCSTYMENFEKVKSSKPIRTFESTKEYQEVLKSVKNKLGLHGSNSFDNKDLVALFNECTYHQAANLQALTPWCSAFTTAEMKVLEYLFDLENYYKASYGYQKMTQKLPCAAIKDMYETLRNSTSNPKVTAYFTHSYMLEMVLTALGTFHDAIPLLGSNYYQQQNRLFATNKFLPFAANFAAIKYECVANQPDQVLFMWNEKPISMPWCVNGEICTLDEIENMYRNSTMNNCPCDICGNEFARISMEKLSPTIFSKNDAACINFDSLTNGDGSISGTSSGDASGSVQMELGYS